MKTNNLKWIAYALSALMLMQSCTVYQKNLSSIDEALVTEKKKRILTTDNETFKVNNIQKVDGNIILTTQTNSSLAKKMSSFVTEIYTDKDQAKLEIPLEHIKGFYLKDNKRSTVATVVAITTPILVVTALVAIAYVSALNNLFGG